jgi:hypothetical protein
MMCSYAQDSLGCAFLAGVLNDTNLGMETSKTLRYEFSYTEKSNWEHLFAEDAEFNIHYKHRVSAAAPGARVGFWGLLTAAVIAFGLV